jgi:hypothetical protein
MKRTEDNSGSERHQKALFEYVSTTAGLRCKLVDDSNIEIHQLSDQKIIQFELQAISDVLSRSDSDGQPFIQVNFKSGKKLLLTGSLIGFKPAPVLGLDLNKLPKVVTTPDLISVFEAIEDAVAMKAPGDELETLKKVFNSILAGGEHVGFDLAQERQWLWCLIHAKATA